MLLWFLFRLHDSFPSAFSHYFHNDISPLFCLFVWKPHESCLQKVKGIYPGHWEVFACHAGTTCVILHWRSQQSIYVLDGLNFRKKKKGESVVGWGERDGIKLGRPKYVWMAEIADEYRHVVPGRDPKIYHTHYSNHSYPTKSPICIQEHYDN